MVPADIPVDISVVCEVGCRRCVASDELFSVGDVKVNGFVVAFLVESVEPITSLVENAVLKSVVSVGSFEISVETCSFVSVEAEDVISEIVAGVPDSVVIFTVACVTEVDSCTFGVEIILDIVGFSEDCCVSSVDVLSWLLSAGEDVMSAAVVTEVIDSVGTVDLDSV